MEMSVQQAFVSAYRGKFTSTMRWHDLDDFWQVLREQADDGWFIYAVGEPAPASTVSRDKLLEFIDRIDELLRREHEEEYCAIVYVDDKTSPSFVKIFDPNNLGVSCGYSENPPLPGWILSRIQPVELEQALSPPKNRRRWWQTLFS